MSSLIHRSELVKGLLLFCVVGLHLETIESCPLLFTEMLCSIELYSAKLKEVFLTTSESI